MICDFGDVVVVPFPFVDRPVVKRRPAMVLTNAAFNAANGQTALAMITSAGASHWPSDLILADIEAAGLTTNCCVRWKVFTLPNDYIVRRAGSLAVADRDRAAQAVRSFVGPGL